MLFFLVWFVFLTTCELFEQAGFCGSEIYLLIYSVFLCRVCCIWGYFCFYSAFVILNVRLFLVASKRLLWLLSFVARSCQTYNLKKPWPLVLVCPLVRECGASVRMCADLSWGAWLPPTSLLSRARVWKRPETACTTWYNAARVVTKPHGSVPAQLVLEGSSSRLRLIDFLNRLPLLLLHVGTGVTAEGDL